jgi:hypothetical protein
MIRSFIRKGSKLQLSEIGAFSPTNPTEQKSYLFSTKVGTQFNKCQNTWGILVG